MLSWWMEREETLVSGTQEKSAPRDRTVRLRTPFHD